MGEEIKRCRWYLFIYLSLSHFLCYFLTFFVTFSLSLLLSHFLCYFLTFFVTFSLSFSLSSSLLLITIIIINHHCATINCIRCCKMIFKYEKAKKFHTFSASKFSIIIITFLIVLSLFLKGFDNGRKNQCFFIVIMKIINPVHVNKSY
jgi:hypothetical protein